MSRPDRAPDGEMLPDVGLVDAGRGREQHARGREQGENDLVARREGRGVGGDRSGRAGSRLSLAALRLRHQGTECSTARGSPESPRCSRAIRITIHSHTSVSAKFAQAKERAPNPSIEPTNTNAAEVRSPMRQKKPSIAALALYFASREVGRNRAWRTVLLSE